MKQRKQTHVIRHNFSDMSGDDVEIHIHASRKRMKAFIDANYQVIDSMDSQTKIPLEEVM